MKKIVFAFFVFSLIGFFNVGQAAALQPVATYTSSDGFKVVSYTQAWADQAKLKSVYDELLRNKHGEELKLLRKINIYPGPDPNGQAVAGRWYGIWQVINGVPVLSGNRYIDLYNGSNLTSVKDFARTISHEYGHHFTYYYYFKKERRSWDDWRQSGLAAARGLKYNYKVGVGNVEHKWLIQEIAAEDYVQLFGSPNAKQNQDFKDISERLASHDTAVTFDTDIYNYHPQENFELPLAANLPGLKQYWLKASGLTNTSSSPPSKVSLRLSDVQFVSEIRRPQYKFTWSRSSDDKTSKLQYTLVWFQLSDAHDIRFYPVKTVTDSEPLEADFGAASDSSMYIWEEVPDSIAYFAVYVEDQDGNITSSNLLAVDFSNQKNPDTVLIDDNSISRADWFSPKVKVNGEQLYFDVAPRITNGRTLVPLRGIFEKLGAKVEWNAKTGTVRAVKGNTEMILQVGKKTAFINGKGVTLDAPAQIIGGRTLVPLRFIGESFGAKVNWNPNLRLANIAS